MSFARRRGLIFCFFLTSLISITLPSATAFGEASAASGWSISPTVNPHMPDGTLSAVSCSGPTFCMAMGEHFSEKAGQEVILAERWDGIEWSIVHTPRPPSKEASLTGISCSAADFCMAVGSYFSARKSYTLAEGWDGAGWSIVPTANATGFPSSALAAVSCTSATACTAVGTSSEGYEGVPLAEVWDGVSWAIQPTPSPGKSAGLAAVSCPSATWCMAVGSYSTTSEDLPLAERWDGASWTKLSIPNPAGTQTSYLLGVSCTTSSACTAVGYTIDGLPEGLLAEGWDGTSWSIQPTPSPEGANGGASLDDIACASATDCIAVGSYHSGLRSFTLVERWDGTEWSIQSSPNKSRSSELSGVACVSVTSCTAVGDYWTGSAGATLAERWDGSSWSIQRTPNHSVNAFSELDGVTCTSASACVAVGYREADGADLTLIERWNGTAWSIQPSPNIPGPRGSFLSAVACATGPHVPPWGSQPTRSGPELWPSTGMGTPGRSNPLRALASSPN